MQAKNVLPSLPNLLHQILSLSPGGNRVLIMVWIPPTTRDLQPYVFKKRNFHVQEELAQEPIKRSMDTTSPTSASRIWCFSSPAVYGRYWGFTYLVRPINCNFSFRITDKRSKDVCVVLYLMNVAEIWIALWTEANESGIEGFGAATYIRVYAMFGVLALLSLVLGGMLV